MLLNELGSGDEEEEEVGEVDVDELSRKIATLEVMNDLDDSEDDWSDIPGTNENEEIVEEEGNVNACENDEEKLDVIVEKVENEIVEEVKEDEVSETATVPTSQLENTQEKESEKGEMSSSSIPPPPPTPTLCLADLFPSTVSLTRSPSLVPDDLNTRMFMLSQQLTSDTPGK